MKRPICITIVESDFASVVEALRGHFVHFYDEMYPERPEERRGFEVCNEHAKWGSLFGNSHLEGVTPATVYQELGLNPADYAGVEDVYASPYPECELWGEVRAGEPLDDPGHTYLEFGGQDLYFIWIDYLCAALGVRIWSFRDDGGENEDGPLSRDFMIHSSDGLEREVRLSFRNLAKSVPGRKGFRQFFEANGCAHALEDERAYQGKSPVDRLSRKALLELMERVSQSSPEAATERKVRQCVLITGQRNEQPLAVSENARVVARAGIRRYNEKFAPLRYPLQSIDL